MNRIEKALYGVMFVIVVSVFLGLFVFEVVSFAVVSGNSMLPTMEDGDNFIYSQYVEPEEGDIIVFEESGPRDRLIVHRVVEINDDEIIAQGDNNDYVDEPIPKDSDRLKGKVISYGGWLNELPGAVITTIHTRG